MQPKSWFLYNPKSALLLCFLAWKTLLLLVAAASPGPGYDTSTSLSYGENPLPTPFQYMIGKLTRWDAIYFVKIARRGHVFEQEWAWWGFPRMITLCTSGIVKSGVRYYDGLEGLVGASIAHVAHLLSTLVLHNLTEAVFPSSQSVALITALLHVIIPAGIFLSAPYAESSCALMSFLGCLLFIKSLESRKRDSLIHDLLIIGSGLSFGIATTFRSNGILNGLLLLEEAFRVLFLLRNEFRLAIVRRLVATGVGGLIVAGGFLLPQYIAYQEFCTLEVRRPWCEDSLPSIYTFVQEHYWDCGLFRYWTLSNLPLFFLAAPVMFILVVSSLWALQLQPADEAKVKGKLGSGAISPNYQVLRNLALSQLVLSVLTSTTAHIQIITRVASAYPLWLWYLAFLYRNKSVVVQSFASFMVIYGLVQAGLFASFLPPA